MNGVFATAGVLFGLVVLGGGVLVWMAPVPAEDITPARESGYPAHRDPP